VTTGESSSPLANRDPFHTDILPWLQLAGARREIRATASGAYRDAYSSGMRTTLTLADDVAAAVEKLRRERSMGLSDAVNHLVRAGLTKQEPAAPFRQQAHDLGRGIDFSNVADTIETLDGPAAR